MRRLFLAFVLLAAATAVPRLPANPASPEPPSTTEPGPTDPRPTDAGAADDANGEVSLDGLDDVPVVQAKLVRRGRPGHRAVREVTRLRPGGGRADWSRQGDTIVFDAPGAGPRRELWTMSPNGTREHCLTCDRWLVHGVSALDPTFHPSGETIVFVGQGPSAARRLDAAELATPLAGSQSELWAISRDGRDAWQLSRVGERGGQVLAPAFGHEGDRLAWSERVRNDVEPWGDWVLRIARFEIRRGLPRLGVIDTLSPGAAGFRHLSGFAPDDRHLLYAAAPHQVAPEALEVFTTPLEPGRTFDLSEALDARDAVARPAPRGEAVVWVSDRGLPPPTRLPYRGDVWVRRGLAPGLAATERLTFFNDPGSDHYLGEALVDDLAWSPEGDRLLVHVVWTAATVEEGLYLISLDPAALPGG